MQKVYKLHMAEQPRSCDGCTLCCKVLMILELDKPKDRWCPHAHKGTGCGIYQARPESCAHFSCLWLSGLTLPEQRPDRVHGVLSPTTDGQHIVLHEDPGFPGVAREHFREYFDKFIASGEHYVIVVSGEHRSLIGRPDLVEKTVIEKLPDVAPSFRLVRRTT